VRIVFMGTRDLAVPALRVIIEQRDAGWDLVGVVTQPDRAMGRSKQPVAPPVKALAADAGIPVFQPETWRDEAAVELLRGLRPDVGVVAGYAQLLPRRVLRIPPAGWLNIHPSLLPRHRGPSPVAACILAGDAETGVSIIKLVSAMDAGPIVDQVRIPIRPDDTTATLTARLADLGAQRLPTVLDRWVAGSITARAQDDAAATYSRLLTRQDGLLDWTRPALDLERQVRAYDPWPGAYTLLEGRRLSVAAAQAVPTPSTTLPGTVLRLDSVAGRPALLIATGDAQLAAFRLQLEGRRELDAGEFVRGKAGTIGARLG
jgi:methionyl-tRNA formyltransferase